jgi:hypothetical protein
MDAQTREHLEHWLERFVHEEERAETREKITALYDSDPEFWSTHSWPEMRAATEC